MNWSERARQTIAAVHAALPADIAFVDRKKAVRDAYPFGPREYWPYKAWCKAQSAYLKTYDLKAPAPPLLRELMRASNPEITFPFAKDKADG